MTSVTQTAYLTQEVDTTPQATLSLLGGDVESSTPGQPTTASVPLNESLALPLAPNESENPPSWPELRGTPRYTPYEDGITNEERPLGQNGAEFGFLVFMLSGVQVVSVLNNLWRSTMGRTTDKVFKYKIGGHW